MEIKISSLHVSISCCNEASAIIWERERRNISCGTDIKYYHPSAFHSAAVQIYAAEACLLVAVAQTLVIIKTQFHL